MTAKQKTRLLRDAHVTVRVLEGEKIAVVANDMRCHDRLVSAIVERTMRRFFGEYVFPDGLDQRIKWLRRNKDLFLPRLRAATGE